VSLSLLISQMSLLDWSLVKDLGVPRVCCALQCFLLEDSGEKVLIYFHYQRLSCAAPVWAGNKRVAASLDVRALEWVVERG